MVTLTLHSVCLLVSTPRPFCNKVVIIDIITIQKAYLNLYFFSTLFLLLIKTLHKHIFLSTLNVCFYSLHNQVSAKHFLERDKRYPHT